MNFGGVSGLKLGDQNGKNVDVSSKIPSLFWKQVSVQMILVTVLEGSFQALGSRSLMGYHALCGGFIQIFGLSTPKIFGKMNPFS